MRLIRTLAHGMTPAIDGYEPEMAVVDGLVSRLAEGDRYSR
jgi:hypothetical protein